MEKLYIILKTVIAKKIIPLLEPLPDSLKAKSGDLKKLPLKISIHSTQTSFSTLLCQTQTSYNLVQSLREWEAVELCWKVYGIYMEVKVSSPGNRGEKNNYSFVVSFISFL